MITDNNKLYLSWDDVNIMLYKICSIIIKDYPNIDSILGIERGGLIPAVLISHELNIPYTSFLKPNTLVIDDICDSGNTLINHPASYTATLVYKPHTSCFKPNIWGYSYEENKFISFPWEKKDAEPIADYIKNIKH